MSSSQATNAALLNSLQRVRERQARLNVIPSSRASSRPQSRAQNNKTAIETISTTPNGEQRVERYYANDTDHSTPRPAWNSAKVSHPTKTPRSVFLGDEPDENIPQRQIITPYRPPTDSEITTPVQILRVPSTVMEEPSTKPPVYIQQPHPTYQTNTKLIRTDPEVIVLKSQPAKRSSFYFFRRKKHYQTRYADQENLLNQPVRICLPTDLSFKKQEN